MADGVFEAAESLPCKTEGERAASMVEGERGERFNALDTLWTAALVDAVCGGGEGEGVKAGGGGGRGDGGGKDAEECDEESALISTG